MPTKRIPHHFEGRFQQGFDGAFESIDDSPTESSSDAMCPSEDTFVIATCAVKRQACRWSPLYDHDCPVRVVVNHFLIERPLGALLALRYRQAHILQRMPPR